MKSKTRAHHRNSYRRTVKRRMKDQSKSEPTPSLFDRMLDGMYRSTHEGRFVDVNPAFVKMFGYSSKQEMLDIVDIKSALYFSPEERGSHILDTGMDEVEAYRMRRKDGSEIWVEDHGRYVHDEFGNVIYHEGILRDITERKRAEEALRDSEARYRVLFDNANDALHFHDEEGRFLDVNQVACERLGYSREELLKMSLNDINSPEAAALIPKRLQEIRERGHSVFEAREVRRDGSTFPVEVSVRPFSYKGKSAILGISRDITERKLAEEASTRLAAIVESSDDAIIGKTLDGTITSWNRGAERLYEYSKEEVVGKPISILVPPDQPDDVKMILERVVRGEPVEHYETKRIRRDGTIIDVSLTVSPIKDHDGRTLGAATIARDTTERKQMEHRLRSLHEHALRLASAEGISEIAKHTLDAMEFTLGFDNADFWMVRDGSISLQDSRGTLFQVTELHIDGPGVIAKAATTKSTMRISDARKESTFLDDPITSASGKVLHMLSEMAVPVLVSNETVAILNVENTGINAFTEHDQMLLETLASHVASALNRLRQQDQLRRYSEHLEELVEGRTKELRSAREQLEYVLSTNPAVVFLEKPLPDRSNWVSTFVSKSALAVFGFEPENLLYESGLKFWESRVPAQDLSNYKDQVQSLWRDGHHAFEYRFLHTDGTYRWIREEQRILRDTAGRVLEGVGVAIDITERKKLEDELAKSQRLATIGETAAMVGHDLRNPLQAMTSALYVAKELIGSPKEEDKEEAVELLGRLDEQVNYMDKIVSDLQNYSGPVTAEPVEIDLPDLIKDVLSNVRAPSNVETIFLSAEDVVRVIADPVLMRRVIINLVTNAVQAMPNGGRLTVTSAKGPNTLSVAVQDTGVGIAPETLEHMFTPFFTKKSKGQGLGLAVCKRLVEAQGGTIRVESKLGKGSIFTVTIPMKGTRGAT